MAQLMYSNLLAALSFMLILVNACFSMWKTFDRRLLLFINFLVYIAALIYVSRQETALWFNQNYFMSSGPYIAYFSIMAAVTSLFFIDLRTKEKINGFLFVSIFLALNLSLLFSANILKIAIVLILFEVLELLLLANTENSKGSLLKDIALSKVFSVISLSMATVFILISRDSVDLFESSILNYDLYYLGICFFIIYLLNVVYIAPLEEIKGISLLNSSNFSVICSVLSKFVILGTMLIIMLKRFILSMEPTVQESVLSGIKVIVLIAIVSVVLSAMNRRDVKKISYYLFCMNSILPLLAVHALGDIDIGLIFFFFALSSLGLFVGIYVERNKGRLEGSRQKGLFCLFYLLGIMVLWGAPTTSVFKIRYLLIEKMISLDIMIIIVAMFMLALGVLWYPIVISLGEKIKYRASDKDNKNPITLLEVIGILLISAQLVVLNYFTPIDWTTGE